MEDAFTHPRRVYWYQKSRSFIWKMCLFIHEEFTGISSEFHMEDAFTHPWRVYWYQESKSFIWKMCLLINGEFTGIRRPEVSYRRCVYSSLKRLLISGVQKFQFTHSWRVYWYHEFRSFIRKMCLLIHGEFTGTRSPEVSYRRCIYSSVESLLVSGVQKFHMVDAITHPWRVYWYQEPKSSIWKMRLLIHGKLLSTFTHGKMWLLIPSEFVYSYWDMSFLIILGRIVYLPLGDC